MNIPVQIDENSAEPLYAQIEKQLRSLIVTGQIAAGTLLPSIREFAGTLRCSVITVRRVYQDLENEGLLRTRQGTGTFVALVEDDMRSGYRLKAVTEALETAIATGIAVQMTEQELLELFAEMVKRRYEVQVKE
ncbi:MULTISPECIES: GntR family transcriptional regulator [Paenibacillus]|uniref:Transcriptional regulator n=2 Tax=Paenibacillus TaxID=44249 RepID=E3EF87_PAEPS|nr:MULTISPECIES: GntR family transcriptional regulator [Paenibacillus]MBU9709258.1 GntR family transcriptional regulator [Paenibacillus sp. AK121]ADO54607.1 transcriptional regulator [Paenibacillus polymyxa SC2]AJE51147.1 transcriptional regulator [Paenibacillus polymyxa]AZH27881.1 GntR family transcriptional regulator [Paenibacillus sp. M-152]KZE71369.1 GntR family transcriptional regulator [Paenibacillus jamilae]